MEILVLFTSKGGHVYDLAKAIGEGIGSVEGTYPRFRRPKETTPIEVIRANKEWSDFYDKFTEEIPEVALSDLTETEGMALGSPTRFGNIIPSLGNFLESCGSLWVSGALAGKPAGVFTSTSTLHGGNEFTIISMQIPLMHLGYVIVPLGYTDPGVAATHRGGTPYGPSSVTGLAPDQGAIDQELRMCQTFGARLATVAKRLRS